MDFAIEHCADQCTCLTTVSTTFSASVASNPPVAIFPKSRPPTALVMASTGESSLLVGSEGGAASVLEDLVYN